MNIAKIRGLSFKSDSCNFGTSVQPFDKMSTDDKLNAIMEQVVKLRINQGVDRAAMDRCLKQLAENQYNIAESMYISGQKTMSCLASSTENYRRYVNAMDKTKQQYKVNVIL